MNSKFFLWALSGGLIIMVVAICLAIGSIVTESEQDKRKQELEQYEEFKNDTELIKGKVIEAKKEGHLIFPDDYNLIVKISDGDIKMLSVSEQEYRTYQAGSNVHFRIDKTNNNSILRDLKNESDIDSLEDYKEYNENSPRHLFR